MLHGLPIAATSVGGPVDILEHGKNALLFSQRDVEALTDAILQLIRKPDLRQRIGLEAAKEVRKNWLWPNIVKRMQSVYKEVASTKACAAIP